MNIYGFWFFWVCLVSFILLCIYIQSDNTEKKKYYKPLFGRDFYFVNYDYFLKNVWLKGVEKLWIQVSPYYSGRISYLKWIRGKMRFGKWVQYWLGYVWYRFLENNFNSTLIFYSPNSNSTIYSSNKSKIILLKKYVVENEFRTFGE